MSMEVYLYYRYSCYQVVGYIVHIYTYTHINMYFMFPNSE